MFLLGLSGVFVGYRILSSKLFPLSFPDLDFSGHFRTVFFLPLKVANGKSEENLILT